MHASLSFLWWKFKREIRNVLNLIVIDYFTLFEYRNPCVTPCIEHRTNKNKMLCVCVSFTFTSAHHFGLIALTLSFNLIIISNRFPTRSWEGVTRYYNNQWSRANHVILRVGNMVTWPMFVMVTLTILQQSELNGLKERNRELELNTKVWHASYIFL